MSKAIDMMPDIRGKCCYGLLIEFTALKSELLEFLAYHKHIVEDHTVGYQVIELDNFALFLPAVLSDDSLSTKQDPLRKPVKRFTFVHGALQHGAQVWISKQVQEKLGADHVPEFTERLVELVAAAIGPQFAQNGRWPDRASFHREHDSQHIRQVRFDHVPIDRLREQRLNMGVVGILTGSGEVQIFPVPDPRHEGNAQQISHPKEGGALRLGVAMQRLRFWFIVRLLKDVENEGPFPDPTGNEMAEAGNIIVRHMIVPDAAIPLPPIADVVLRQEILLIYLPLGSVGRGMFARPPEPGQVEAVIRMNHEPDRFIQVLAGDMALIDPGDVAAIHGVQ
jgi:hypothetical protein